MKTEPLIGPFAMERRLLDDWSNSYELHLRAREHRAAAIGAVANDCSGVPVAGSWHLAAPSVSRCASSA